MSALKSFDFEAATNALPEQQAHGFKPRIVPPPNETQSEKEKRLAAQAQAAADDQAWQVFLQVYGNVLSKAHDVVGKQNVWRVRYQHDLNVLAGYTTHDFRGIRYVDFDPGNDHELDDVRYDRTFPTLHIPPSPDDPPTESDFAPLQLLISQMSDLRTRLIKPCTDTGVCDDGARQRLQDVENDSSFANAVLAAVQDNFKALQTAQASVATSYNSLDKVYQDYQTRLHLHTIYPEGPILVQDIRLGPDYGATDTGSITCTNDATPTQQTTDAINYSVLYQNVPAFTVSAGLLTTFQKKIEIGTIPKLNANGTFSTYFAVTDSANAQVFPMAFTNFRVWQPVLKNWWGQPENELVITNSISTGIGVNSNTGTNQPEFFVGDAIGFSRVYLHLGAHFGRTESLGGGFQLNTVVPTGFSGSAPINWSYHPAFSIGLSVRIAPF